MKVSLNLNTQTYNNFCKGNRNFVLPENNAKEQSSIGFGLPENISPVCYSNISFTGVSSNALLKYSDRLKCAYTGTPMISHNEIAKIFNKMVKRPNAQTAINLLQNYTKYMHEIELEVFKLFQDSDHKNKKTFSDILQEYVPNSLERLKIKQKNIFNSTKKLVEQLSPKTRAEVEKIVEDTLVKIENGGFTRKYPLELLNSIKGAPEDSEKLSQIYYAWFQLPRSSKDIDAFIVSYSKCSHDSIARRLLSPAEVTIEHIKPQSRNGLDCMSNYLLVCKQANNERNSMPLDEYIKHNPEMDIPKHLQEYIEDVIKEVGIKDSILSVHNWYPEAIQKAIIEESGGFLYLDLSNYKISKTQRKKNDYVMRLGTKYVIKQK